MGEAMAVFGVAREGVSLSPWVEPPLLPSRKSNTRGHDKREGWGSPPV